VAAVRVLAAQDLVDGDVVAAHVALPPTRPAGRALIRLNMISSADGGTTVGGVSGGLGNRNDHAVFEALRDRADGVLVGLATVVAERYGPPVTPDLQLYVVTPTPDISGNPELFASRRATLVLPEDAPAAPAGVPDLRAGGEGRVDLAAAVDALAGQVVVLEGGPRLAGAMLGLGLVDEFFHTIAPMVIGGESARVAHGPPGDPSPWGLQHGFCDDAGYLFLRYARTS
jgi:riboflavin biosynthesis pyrimidine reductase